MSVTDRTLRHRRWIIIAFHAGMITFGYWLAYLLRFEFPLSSEDQQQFVRTLPLILIVRLAIFAWYHLYEGLWRYVSIRDMCCSFVLGPNGREVPAVIYLRRTRDGVEVRGKRSPV